MLLPDTTLLAPIPPCEDTQIGICLMFDQVDGRDAYWLTLPDMPDIHTEVPLCGDIGVTACLVPPTTEDTTSWWVINPSMVKDLTQGA